MTLTKWMPAWMTMSSQAKKWVLFKQSTSKVKTLDIICKILGLRKIYPKISELSC